MKGVRFLVYSTVLLMMACASIGNPDGGRYDETPPRVVASYPADRSTGVNKNKIQILFDEFIKLEKASEKVVISPPQIEPANVRADGKRIKVDFYDSLQANTTYTVDFSDAIEDNNEGNPMGHYTYSFSTGAEIDTMEVAGTVLDAQNLEPIKGVLVGLYPADSAFSDTLFTTTPFRRVSRTNGSGHFSIKGVRPGHYRAYALEDKDGNFIFSQKSERVAFDTTVFRTYSKPDVRMDTIWRDTTHYDSIRVIPYTHYYPDDIVLMAFMEDGQEQHLLKTERSDPYSFKLFFTAPADSLPKIKGLNFDEACLVVDASQHNDTIVYWVTDTMFTHQQDTLTFALTYMETDTLGVLQQRTDTLELSPKTTYEKIRKERQNQIDAWNKDRERKAKKAKAPLPPEENPYEVIYLAVSAKPSGSIDPNQNVRYSAKEPIASVDTTMMRFYVKQDTNWIPEPFLFLPDELDKKSYVLYAEWEPKKQYKFEADSTAFRSVMGTHTKFLRQEFKVRGEEEFGSIFIHTILEDTGVVVQLMNKSDKVVRERRTDSLGNAEFYYVRPAEYYLRCFIDKNGNGIWDTGNYTAGQQAEEVFYFPKPLALKAQWELEQDWDVRGIKRTDQKPKEITKQKPDKEKSVRQKNLERDKEKQNRGKKTSRER